jgi:hypothetical protein
VVLVDVGTVVVLTTGHTATTGRLAVLADTTFTGRDMATVLAGLGETGRHCGGFVVVVGSKSSLVKSRSWDFEKLCFSSVWSCQDCGAPEAKALSAEGVPLCCSLNGLASDVRARG